MGCCELREGESLPSIDTDDVENNDFSTSLTGCVGRIYNKLDKDIDALDKFNEKDNEKVTNRCT